MQLLVRSTLSPVDDFFYAHGGMPLDLKPSAVLLLMQAAAAAAATAGGTFSTKQAPSAAAAVQAGVKGMSPACTVALPLRDRLRIEGPDLEEDEVGLSLNRKTLQALKSTLNNN